ncbi:nucleolar and coiled-body phosphoprotein 1-like [Schistocerca cancellata]|uniref:nucleolar and coiled-body phosphoprotein 1-like n=1 Tax=Schistocerca cancellata TaxID=274614 RepID=UPI0021173AA2|nr:nucleolar and coiled-body phosphoprotein 1-like [Schistocerca cancellata]
MGKNKRGRRGKKSNRRRVAATGAPIESADKVCSCTEHYHSDEYYDSDEFDYEALSANADDKKTEKKKDENDYETLLAQAYEWKKSEKTTTPPVKANCSEKPKDEDETERASSACDGEAEGKRRKRRRKKPADSLPAEQANSNGERHGCTTQQANCSEEAQDENALQAGPTCDGDAKKTRRRRRRGKRADALPPEEEAAPQSVEQPPEETADVVSEKKKRRRRRKHAMAFPPPSEDGASGSGGGSRPEQAAAVAGGFSSLKQLEEQVIAEVRWLFSNRLPASVLESLLKASK